MKTSIEIGRDVLGPIFYRFCYRLWLSQACYDSQQSCMLFLSRGGIRLRHYYELFLQNNRVDSPLEYKDFYTSRMAAFTANLPDNPTETSQLIAAEYNGCHITQAFKMILDKSSFNKWYKLLGKNDKEYFDSHNFSAEFLLEAIGSKDVKYKTIKEYFVLQEKLAREHFSDLTDSKENVILVDTGWSGSIINTLQNMLPETSLMALFFGRYNYGLPPKHYFGQIVGLEVEADKMSYKRPETSIFMHRHLIEGVCEIRWKSVERYVRLGKQIIPESGIAPEENIIPDDSEGLAKGIMQYINSCKSGLQAGDINKNAHQAYKKLQSLICFPKTGELEVLAFATRSADFGKDIDVPMLVKSPGETKRDKKINIAKSLWPSARVALEYKGIKRYLKQKKYIKKHS